MYINRLGMTINADYVVVQLMIEDLQIAIQTIIQKQIGKECNVVLSHSDSSNHLYLTLGENEDSILQELIQVGYTMGTTEDLQLAVSLMFEIEADYIEIAYDTETGFPRVRVEIEAEQYYRRVFDIN